MENKLNAILTTVLGCLMLFTGSSAFAELNIEKFVPGGSVVAKSQGPDDWVIYTTKDKSGTLVNLWESPTGLVVFGKVFDQNGRDLTRLKQEKMNTARVGVALIANVKDRLNKENQAGAGEVTTEEGIYDRLRDLSETNYLPTGTGDRKIYAFYDYACKYCSAAHKDLTVANVGATIHWIPVSLTRSSVDFNAAMLDKKLGFENMGDFSTPPPSPSKKSLKALAQNTSLLKSRSGSAGTPLFVYQDSGGTVRTVVGYQEGFVEKLKSEFGSS